LLDFARWIELKYRLTFALNLVQFWQLQEGGVEVVINTWL
jgi:hypothetical protein